MKRWEKYRHDKMTKFNKDLKYFAATGDCSQIGCKVCPLEKVNCYGSITSVSMDERKEYRRKLLNEEVEV